MTSRQPAPGHDIAASLQDWALREMHFHPQGAFAGTSLTSACDPRRICRGTQLTDVWKFILDYVRSVQTVKKMRGNLQLKALSQQGAYRVKYKSDGVYDDQQQALMSEKSELQGEMTSLLSETQQLQAELLRMQADIQTAETEYQKQVELIRDLGRKTCLLQAYGQAADDFNTNIDAFSERMEAKRDAIVKGTAGVDKALHTAVDADADSASIDGDLETATSRDVRMSCEHIGKFLHQTLQGSFIQDKNAFQVNKDLVWKQVETTLSDHNVQEVVSCLVRQSQQESLALRKHTMKINIHEDAQKLRFKYEKGGVLTDTATQPSLLHSIQQLLEENQQQHVGRFVETERHRNSTHPLRQHMKKTRSKIDAVLNKRLASQPGTLKMAKLLVQHQLDAVGDRTGREVYRQVAAGLREDLAREQAGRDCVLALHQQIQDFQHLANGKQNVIQVVAKQNAGARARLGAQQFDVSQYIRNSISSHPMETCTLTTALRGTMSSEVDKMAALCLPYLLSLYLDRDTKRGLLDLSITHTMHPSAMSVRPWLQRVLAEVDFAAYKAPECLLKHCLQLKAEGERDRELTNSLHSHCFTLLMGSGVHTDLDHINELCDKVRAQDREELQTLLPVLQKRVNNMARASNECLKIRDCMQSWWEQPAQFIPDWQKVDGLTYQQWSNKWKIVSTKLRQLQLHK